jgi:hypothetical protein
MLEHHLKARLSIAIELQVRGDELVAKHYATLPKDLGGVLPSLTLAWERLSECLHTRTGEVEEYQRQRDAICKHFRALDLLSPASPLPGGTYVLLPIYSSNGCTSQQRSAARELYSPGVTRFTRCPKTPVCQPSVAPPRPVVTQ